MVHPATRQLAVFAKWWARTRDVPEVMPLYAWLAFAAGIAGYTAKKVYFNPDAGAYLNVNLRGDAEAQAATATVASQDPHHKTHSMWWHAAQVKMDDDGANIGVFNNRVRPHQYSKPGHAGMGAGVPSSAAAAPH